MKENESRINARDLAPGDVFHTSNTDTLYVSEGYPHIDGGRARIVYHVLGEPALRSEFICQTLSSLYVVA